MQRKIDKSRARDFSNSIPIINNTRQKTSKDIEDSTDTINHVDYTKTIQSNSRIHIQVPTEQTLFWAKNQVSILIKGFKVI